MDLQRSLRIGVVVLTIMGSIFLLTTAQATPTAEEFLNQINKLSQDDRQARLEREARKEGSVAWYVAMNRTEALNLAKAFEAEYPFLKVNLLSGGGPTLVNRVLTEYRSGTHLYDVMVSRSLLLDSLRRAGAIMRYQTPYRKLLRDGFYDPEGYLNGIFATPQIFLFNTKLVSHNAAPKSIEDLLQPEWKGRLAIDNEAFDWLAALLDYYGEEKGKEIARKFGQQNPQLRRGHTLVAQLVAAGEIPVTVDSYLYGAAELKKAGAPVDYVFPKPYIPVKTPTNAYAASKPPHPHAMALFLDFLLSEKKGQRMMREYGHWVAHKELIDANLGDRNTLIPSVDKWGKRADELAKLFGQLVRQQGP